MKLIKNLVRILVHFDVFVEILLYFLFYLLPNVFTSASCNTLEKLIPASSASSLNHIGIVQFSSCFTKIGYTTFMSTSPLSMLMK
jgi:hypothetical protein